MRFKLLPFFCPLFQEAGDGGDGGGGNNPPPENPVHFHPDGKLGDGWHTALGDEFAPHAAQAAQFKTVGDLFKSYTHLRATGPAYPGEGAAPDDIQRFHALAKVPVDATPEAYGIQLPADIPEGDKAVYDRLLKAAHANHLSGPGFAAVVKEYQAIQAEQAQAFEADMQAGQKAAQDELVGEWKGNFEANASTVRHLASKFGEAAGLDAESINGLANIPAFSKLMFAVSQKVSEDRINTPAGMGDLRSAQQRADSIMDGSDPVWGKKYMEGSTEDRIAAYNEVSRLMKEAQR